MLEVNGLHVRYTATHAVKGVSFEVSENEVVCLLGPNGAGKTSILRSISQLAYCDGTIRYDGDDVAGIGTPELGRRGLIHVPEGRHVFPTLTVHENLRIGEIARAGRAAKYSLDDVYDLFPKLTEMRKRRGFALSGGEQQMVALGRALIAAPRLLMLDEPSLGLAPAVVSAVYKALAEVATETPILLVEQNTTDALSLSHRGYVLAEGHIVMSGDCTDLSDRSSIMASYLGQSDVENS
ncbi:ABC transporter ATP-binding protein [Williamsia soli]|uniref:ABC transporter ATP-binding protein n=1 Tax=Williamsia soli TaxID=364929 RepID=UPI001A9F60FD|nr:ABC transporter ATP-binding protein [Williamsia soli]